MAAAGRDGPGSGRRRQLRRLDPALAARTLPSGGGAHDHGAAGHGAVSAAGTTALGASFVLSWIVMTAAMMLPTTIPLLQIFRRLTLSRSDRVTLLLLVVGYVAAWAACGVSSSVRRGDSVVRERQRVARREPADPDRRAPPGGRRLSVLGAEVSLSRQMPIAAEFRDQPLAGSRERWHSFKLGVEHGGSASAAAGR